MRVDVEVAAEERVADLVVAAQAGDLSAWPRLTARFDGMVRATAARYRMQDADAADVVQSTWLSAYEQLGALREPERFGGWLRVIARNECLDVWAHAARERPAEELVAAVVDSSPGAEELVLRAEAARAVRVALAGMPGQSRTLVEELFFLGPVDYAAVARSTGRAIGGIGPTRARVLLRLRTQLVRRGFGPSAVLTGTG